MTASILDPVQRVARTHPDALAVLHDGGELTYGALDRRVSGVAARLRAHGFAEGDRLAIYRPTSAEYLVVLLAAFRAGIVACPLNTRLPPDAVPEYLALIDCRALVASPDLALDEGEVIDLDTYRGAREDVAPAVWELSAPATLVFTSGSTGTPKAALHTLGNHVWSARGLAAAIPLGPGDRWLLDLPLYHVGGLAVLVRCVLAGAAVVLPERGAAAGEAIAAQGVTHASFVATQLLRLLGGEASSLAGMKAVLLGGSAIPPGLLNAAVDAGVPVHTSYGMTEMTSTVTATPQRSTRAALGTSGAVLPHRQVRIADDGEVLVRGETLFAGYAQEGKVERPDVGDGWFPTGDLGMWVEEEGRPMVQVIGRKDNLFISGGENIQPEEIEAALGRLRGVRRAVVVPVEDAEFGQRPVAFVDAAVWEPEIWTAALRATLAAFKTPAAFYPWPDAEEEGIKVDRAVLRSLADRSG